MVRILCLPILCVMVMVSRAPCEEDREASKLLSDLESFSAMISEMIQEATPEASKSALSPEKRWRFRAGTRLRYERFRLSNPKSTIPDPTDSASVRQALDELNALIDRAKESGIDDPNLDEAQSMAEEAASILADPAGDLEEAADLIVVARVLAETAIEISGSVGDARFIDYDESVSQDWLGGGFFETEYRRNFEDGSRFLWNSETEGGNRFYSAGNEVRWTHPLNDKWTFLAQNLTEIRVYRRNFADDVFENETDLELRWEPKEKLQFEFGGQWDYRTEYDSESDDGYRDLSPRCAVSVDLGDWGRTGLRYDRSEERHLDKENEKFDYDRDRLRAWWDFFGERTQISLNTEVSWKDLNRENDRDDYREESAAAYCSYDWFRDTTVGIRSEWTTRQYDSTGSFDAVQNMVVGNENTDSDGFLFEPFLELEWTSALTTRLEYRYSGVRNEDRYPNDGIDKSKGDYDAHQVAVEMDWTLPWGIDLNIRDELQYRGFLHGETGTIETWFTDLRYLADCTANTISAWLSCPIAKNTQLEMSVFTTFERYERFQNLNNDQTTVSLELTYSF